MRSGRGIRCKSMGSGIHAVLNAKIQDAMSTPAPLIPQQEDDAMAFNALDGEKRL